jgi:hypothetical protein
MPWQGGLEARSPTRAQGPLDNKQGPLHNKSVRNHPSKERVDKPAGERFHKKDYANAASVAAKPDESH